jgi:IPT/TIG domain
MKALAIAIGLALAGAPVRAPARGHPSGGKAPSPLVGAVEPDSGSSQGGTAIAVTGSDFRPGATLTLGNVEATQVVVVSSSRLTAVTGPHAPGSVVVTVRNRDGQSGSRGRTFTYVDTSGRGP